MSNSIKALSRRTFAAWMPVVMGSALVSENAQAGPVVAEGTRLHFSPRGQKYFQEHLETVLLANELDLGNQTWDEVKVAVDDPLDEARLPPKLREAKGEQLRAIRARLGSHFFGFPIETPKVEVRLGKVGLPAKFRALGAELDPRGPTAHGKRKGVVILLRMEAENLSFVAEQVRVRDLANPDFLGTLGVDRLVTRLRDGDARRVKVEVPVHVDADGKTAKMEILAVRTNLHKAEFATDFARMLLPSVKLVVNGREYAMNGAAFEREFRAMLPEVTDTLVSAAKAYFEKDGAKLVQPEFDSLAKSLNVDFEVLEGLGVALRPARVETTARRHLGIVFHTEIRDAKAPAQATFPTPGTASAPALAEVDPSSYDLAVTAHPGVVNGIVGRAWANDALGEVEIGKDDDGRATKVKLPRAPIVSLPASLPPGRANFHAWIAYPVKGLQGVLFKHPIPIELDLRVRLETNAKNEIEVVLEEIDERTLRIDASATWLAPIRGAVEKNVREKIAKANADMRRERQVMTSLPTLDKLIGIPLSLDTLRSDGGNLVLYADFLAPTFPRSSAR